MTEEAANRKPWTDLALALEHPTFVTALEIHCHDGVPDTVVKLQNLEHLAVSGKFERLPDFVATFPRLRSLDLSGCFELRSLPDEVLAMPTLRELRIYDTRLPRKYVPKVIAQLLDGFAKADITRDARLLHVALLLGNDKRVRELGSIESLLGALDSNVGAVRDAARRALRAKIEPVSLSLAEGMNVVVVGKLNVERALLSERLEARGVALAKKLGPKTGAIVVGEQPKGKAAPLAGHGVPIVFEDHLRAFLEQGDTPHLVKSAAEGAESSSKLSELLSSKDSGTVKLALEMMKIGGVPIGENGVLEELFLVTQDANMEAKVREHAKKLFAQYAPPQLQDAIKKVLARTSIFASGETKCTSRIKAMARHAKGAFDPVKLATLLLRGKRGYTYLFEVAKKGQPEIAVRALAALVVDDALELPDGELSELPDALGALGSLRTLNLDRNHFHALPEVVLRLGGLEALHISQNRLETLPADLTKLERLQMLDASCNFFRTIPEVVFEMKELRALDLSTAKYDPMREIPLKAIPDGIGKLTKLEELRFGAHHLETLPESLKELENLQTLSLRSGKLHTLPEWLVELPKLGRLELDYVERGDEASFKAVVPRLEARGVAVFGV